MKKLLSLLLVLVFAISLAACGGGADPGQGTAATPAPPAATPGPGATPAPAQPDPAPVGGLPSDADFAPGEFPFPLATSTGFRTQEDVLANLVVQPHDPGTLIFGAGTTPAGNGITGWGTNATDGSMQTLIHGNMSILSRTQYTSVYEWNPVVVREAWFTENADGSRTFGARINENLRFSDGTPITARDYVFFIMLNSSNEMQALDGTNRYGNRLVGFEEFINGESRTFAGVRLYDEFSFSMTVRAEFFPYFHAFTHADLTIPGALRPFPVHHIAPGVTISDNGSGATWCDNLTVDLLRHTLLDPDVGYRWHPAPSAGPYRFVSYDMGAQVYILEINPYFLATWDGYVPSIQQIAIRLVQGAVSIDELEVGSVHLSSIGLGNIRGNELYDLGRLGATVFPSPNIWQLRFFSDVGPMQFREVRQAIAWSIDRDEYNLLMNEGRGRIVNSIYLPGSFIHNNHGEWLEDNLTHHTLNRDRARNYLIEGGWVLNENGQPFVEGTDRMRHKMVDGELMPLEIIWAANPNLDADNAILYTAMVPNAEAVGMIIHQVAVTSVTATASRTGFTGGENYMMLTLSSGHGAATSYVSFWNLFQIEDWAFFESQRTFYLPEQRLSDQAILMRNTPPEDVELFNQRELEMHALIDYYRPALFFWVGTSRFMHQPWLQNYEMGTSWGWEHAILRAYSTR